jgi:hypothetical protein
MKNCSEELLSTMRGFLCKSEYPTLQYVGEFGTDAEVVEMTDRVVMSAQPIFDLKAPMDREIYC